MSTNLSVENVQQHEQRQGQRRQSVSTRDSSDHSVTVGPTSQNLSQAHRRMSRIVGQPGLEPGHFGRRMSMYRRPSVAYSVRTEQSHLAHLPVKVANTYKLGPDPSEKFNASKVEKTLNRILESYLDGETYEAKKCCHMVQNLTEVIKNSVKEMHFPRYKFVCNVVIGQEANQGFQSASRSVWNTSTDNYACGIYRSSDLFAIATVFGTYFE